jgi:hypothetical protein
VLIGDATAESGVCPGLALPLNEIFAGP